MLFSSFPSWKNTVQCKYIDVLILGDMTKSKSQTKIIYSFVSATIVLRKVDTK